MVEASPAHPTDNLVWCRREYLERHLGRGMVSSDRQPMDEEVFAQATSEAGLRTAWDEIRRNRGMAGSDGVELASFGSGVAVRLAILRARLLAR